VPRDQRGVSRKMSDICDYAGKKKILKTVGILFGRISIPPKIYIHVTSLYTHYIIIYIHTISSTTV
jgi:hypothetical protein